MSGDSQAAGVYARESAYLDRFVQVGYASGRVLSVSFPATPDGHGTEHAILDRIDAYLEGARETFDDVDVALSAALPTEQRDVLVEVREIPYGKQLSCGKLAAMTPGLDPDDASDLQLVRTALAENPAPLIVADHRVRDGPSAAPPEIEQRLRSLEGL
jgi:methylated-DNA-[protein]-cysteine S-methyltransferase